MGRLCGLVKGLWWILSGRTKSAERPSVARETQHHPFKVECLSFLPRDSYEAPFGVRPISA